MEKRHQVNILGLVKYYIDQLGLHRIFSSHIDKGKAEVEPASCLCVLISNLILSPMPLYSVETWIQSYCNDPMHPEDLGVRFNDDRLGRALDALYKADRNSILTEVTLSAIQTHKLKTDVMHNDTTSVTFSGEYDHQVESAVQLKQGYNKDHRPDCLQIVFGLNTTQDGHVPLFFQLYDGNKTDDNTHIINWTELSELLQNQQFIYIADSKLSTYKNLTHLDSHGGKFISILPKTRREIKQFHRLLSEGKPEFKFAYEAENTQSNKPGNRFEIYEGAKTKEGFRILWVRSQAKVEQDRHRREKKLDTINQKLTELSGKFNAYHLKTKADIKRAVKSILGKSESIYSYDIIEHNTEVHKKVGRGKPGPDSQYQTLIETSYELKFELNQQAIEQQQVIDGIFPLVTNTDLPAVEVLKHYKKQPYLEKRFNNLKSLTQVAPVFLKKNTRIEALMLLYFIALMVISLMERNIRKSMKEQNIEKLPIRPGRSYTKAPTLHTLKQFFRNVMLQTLYHEDNTTTCKIYGLTPLHLQVSDLMGIPRIYWDSFHEYWYTFTAPS